MSDLDLTAEKKDEKELEFLCVRMEDAVCGFELSCVWQIVRDSRVTPVPCVPEYYEGLCNWKGTIIPVASLSRMTGTKEKHYREQQVIIITEADELQCGFLVNTEPEILRVPDSARLAGDIPERLGESVRIKAAYALGEEVIYVIDAQWTLGSMVVYD